MQKITPFLWFDSEAEEAAQFYTTVFPDAKIVDVSRYSDAGPGAADEVLNISFELFGLTYVALNGGPAFSFNEAISFQVDCADQDEVDYFWDALSEGGEPGQCAWLKDRYGVSWQIVPRALPALIGDPDPARFQRAIQAMLGMTKIDIAALERAADGTVSTG